MFRKLLALVAFLLLPCALFAQGQRVIWSPAHQGTTLYVSGVAHLTYVGPSSAITSGPAARTGDTMEVSWKHQDAAGGTRTVCVRLERDPGQSMPSFSSEFGDLVSAMAALFPPNVGPDTSGPTPPVPPDVDGVLQVSWQHDPDGTGPLQPMTVTARVEKRDGESSADAARRLKKMVDELSELFPPNVGPETP